MKRRLGELRRRFNREDDEGPRESRGGQVGPPFEARWSLISDKQWLEAMRKHDKDEVDRWGDDFLKGGARELATQLEECTKSEPERFAALCLALPVGSNHNYLDAIVRGLKAAAKDGRPLDAASIWDVVRYGFGLLDRLCGRWVSDLIGCYAESDVPADIIDMVGWYATEDPDPHPEARAFMFYPNGLRGEGRYDAFTHGLNTARGSMCSTIGALLFADGARIDQLRPAIERLVRDPSLAVRTHVPYALLPMLNFEADTAVEYFLTLCDCGHELVPITPSAQQFLRYACRTHLDLLEPLLQRMLSSQYDEVRQKAAEHLAFAVYRGQRDVSLMEALWARGDSAIRAALAKAGCWVIIDGSHEHHELALSLLTRSFIEDEVAAAAAARCFRQIGREHRGSPISLLSLTPLFDAFIDSPAFEANRSDLMFLLDKSGLRLPDVVLRAFERTLTVESNFQPFDTALLYRLYEDSTDPAIRRRCLDLIDGLLRKGNYRLQRTLQELDGPA